MATMDADDRVGLVTRLAKFLGVGREEAGSLIIKQEDLHMDEAVRRELDSLRAEIARLMADKESAEALAKAAEAIALAKTEADIHAAVTAVPDALRKQLDARVTERKAALAKSTTDEELAAFRKLLPAGLHRAFDELNATEQRAFMSKAAKGDESDPTAKTLTKLAKDNESLAGEVAKLQAEANLRKVRDEIKDLDGIANLDELASTLTKLRSADRDAADAMLTQLRATAKQAKEGGLFKVLGGGGAGSDAETKLAKAAAEYHKAHPDLTKEQAEAAVLNEKPELYTEYLAAQEA